MVDYLDIYRLNHKYTVRGETCMNVYYYLCNDASPSADSGWGSFVLAWQDVFTPTLTPIQSTNTAWVSAEVTNLMNFSDFGVYGLAPTTGDRVGDTEPAFMTWTFTLNRSARQLRNGRKAISGLVEADHSGDRPDSAILVYLESFATALSDDLVDVHGTVFTPVIVRIPPGGVPPTLYTPVSTATFRWVSTQNTRKRK